MALLYERSRTWRAIVHATRDRRILALFLGVSVGGATILAWGSQAATDALSVETRKELEDLKRRDYETARYATHSKAALQKMFSHVKGDDDSSQSIRRSEKAQDHQEGNGPIKQQIKLPGIAWHPKAVERDERARQRRQAATSASGAAAAETSSSDK